MNRYSNIKQFKDEEGKRYLGNVIYPYIPETSDDLYIITTGGDRYDTLAQQFYGDYRLWWIIASANNSKKSSMFTQPGVQLRVPADKNNAIELFNNLNNER
jgi:hypothetical protein